MAIFIPKAPQNIEVIAPVTKAMVVYQVLAWSTQKNTTAPINTINTDIILY